MKQAVAIFNRKSRTDGDNDTTLANHRTQTRQLCERNDYHYTEYEEILSGATKFEDRTELLRMLADVKQGLYFGVVVVELQRLARSGQYSQMIADTLEQHDVKIITPTMIYNLRDSTHRLMFDMMSAMGVNELKTTDNRMRNGLITKAKSGQYVSAQAPYGYDAVWDDPIKRKTRTLVPNGDADHAKLIFDLADKGHSLRDITIELNQRGVSTINGKEWYIRTIQHILNNKSYTGALMLQLKDKYTKQPSELIEVPDAFPALVTIEQWNRVQLAVKSRLSGDMETRTRSRGQVRTILKDLVFCNVCDRKTGYTSSAKRPNVLVVKRCECGNKGIVEPTLAEKFYNELKKVEQYWQEQWDMVLNGTLNTNTDDLDSKLADLETNKAKYTNRSKNARVAFLDGDITREEYLADKADFDGKIAVLDISIAEVKEQMSQMNVDSISTQMKDRFTILDKVRKSTDTKEVNRLLKLIIERVHYQRINGEVVELMIAPK
ncbi:recombinase family protein [Paenibacillus sp. V4I7]|uniref:recombinase family protein n=1 Tax=Paenibacillus sp. V4I7 TaxID=3042307 RepID=UPI0027883F1F|nr:recombinase family protein [Paenibacillus sp. V4I7]MDQ0898427.1 site-specific DNA recombinase [Paenibacillus sp. V4I7]